MDNFFYFIQNNNNNDMDDDFNQICKVVKPVGVATSYGIITASVIHSSVIAFSKYIGKRNSIFLGCVMSASAIINLTSD